MNKEAHRIYDILRPPSPPTEKPSFALPTMSAKEQSEILRSKLLPEERPLAVYESEDHRRRYAWGKTKRKKRRKPKTKRKKHTKKRKIKKRKSTRKK